MIRRLLLAALLCALGLGFGQALAGGEYFVQLAAMRSEAGARTEWARLQEHHPDLLGDLALDVQRADLGDRGVFFRIRTGPFPNQATAQDMCWQIKAAKLGCLLVRPK